MTSDSQHYLKPSTQVSPQTPTVSVNQNIPFSTLFISRFPHVDFYYDFSPHEDNEMHCRQNSFEIRYSMKAVSGNQTTHQRNWTLMMVTSGHSYTYRYKQCKIPHNAEKNEDLCGSREIAFQFSAPPPLLTGEDTLQVGHGQSDAICCDFP